MNNKIAVWSVIALIFIILGIVYFYVGESQEKSEPKSYDECAQQVLSEMRKYKPASEEQIGTKRTDDEGNIWIKQDGDQWKTDAKGFESTAWGNLLIDEQKGGAEYTPKELPQCKKYIYTNNSEMEKVFANIVNKVIQEQSKNEVSISVEKIQVLNLVAKVQGSIKLKCDKNVDFATEDLIIKSISDNLFVEYPNDFAEESERKSWVDVSCAYEMGWRIENGHYNMKV